MKKSVFVAVLCIIVLVLCVVYFLTKKPSKNSSDDQSGTAVVEVV